VAPGLARQDLTAYVVFEALKDGTLTLGEHDNLFGAGEPPATNQGRIGSRRANDSRKGLAGSDHSVSQ
jgi:hypothetical protein